MTCVRAIQNYTIARIIYRVLRSEHHHTLDCLRYKIWSQVTHSRKGPSKNYADPNFGLVVATQSLKNTGVYTTMTMWRPSIDAASVLAYYLLLVVCHLWRHFSSRLGHLELDENYLIQWRKPRTRSLVNHVELSRRNSHAHMHKLNRPGLRG